MTGQHLENFQISWDLEIFWRLLDFSLKFSTFSELRKFLMCLDLENFHDKSGLRNFSNDFGLNHFSDLTLKIFT